MRAMQNFRYVEEVGELCFGFARRLHERGVVRCIVYAMESDLACEKGSLASAAYLNTIRGRGMRGATHEVYLLTSCFIGDFELLEATSSHLEVFPSRRRSNCKITTEFHDWFLRGMSTTLLPSSIHF